MPSQCNVTFCGEKISTFRILKSRHNFIKQFSNKLWNVMVWGKGYEKFFDTQKKFFLRTLFWKKHFLKILKIFSPLKCHTKTVRNKRCKLKVIYLNKFLSNCNVNTIKISSFSKVFEKLFFCILSVFYEFWLKWSYQLHRKICFSHIDIF